MRSDIQTNEIAHFSVAVAEAPSRFNDADYLAVMCHEVSTPLSSIIGLSHVLTDAACSPQKKAECAEMLRDSSTMLMELMRRILDSAKLSAGMIELETVDFDLDNLVQEAVNIMATRAAEKGIDLYIHLSKKLSNRWTGDPLRIRQVLLNLLSNAIKFTEKGSVCLYVSAKTDREGRELLHITVADTGIGIGKDALEKIFRKYVQADSQVSRKYGGTGLGLSISQELVQLMRGHIAVKSWPGMGSHFVVTLPLQKAAGDAGQNPQQEANVSRMASV